MRSLLLFLAPVLFAQSDTKYSIQGRVTDDINHAGVARAKLTLKGGGMKSDLTATTGDGGAFSFPDLAAGSYHLNIEKAGFFPQAYEDAIDVGSTPHTDLGDVAIMTQRSISGTVKWADGEPVVEASVIVLAITGSASGPQFKTAGSAISNDRGEFHSSALRPGRYVLFAELFGQGARPDMEPRIVVPVFYPPSPVPNPAASIDLRTRAEFAGAEFVFEEKLGVDIMGTISTSASTPAGTHVGLSLSSVSTVGIGDMQSFIFAGGPAGEPFQFHSIPPGTYFLLMHILIPGENGRSLGYRRSAQSLVVGSEPLKGLTLVPPEATPLVGKVEIEDADGKISPADKVPVVTSTSRLGLYGSSMGRPTDADGAFRRNDTIVGEAYKLRITPPADAYVAKITQGGRDVTDAASVSEGGGEVRILLKKDGGTVTGRVQQSDGSPARGFIVLAPKNRKAADRFMTTTAARDGGFKLSSVAPGEYDLFAIDQNEDDFYFDETYLRRFKGTAVSVAPSAGVSYQLEVSKTRP